MIKELESIAHPFILWDNCEQPLKNIACISPINKAKKHPAKGFKLIFNFFLVRYPALTCSTFA
jgi:hypothetical protein